MADLTALRNGWELTHIEEMRLLRAMTIAESVRQWARLQTAFEWQIQKTESLFQQTRRDSLAELQARLRRLV